MATFGELGATAPNPSGALAGNLLFTGGQVGEAGTLTDVTIWVRGNNVDTPNAWIAIYKSATSDPTVSSSLIAYTDPITTIYNTTLTQRTYSLANGTKSFAAGDYLWIAFMTHDTAAATAFEPYLVTETGNWAVANGANKFRYQAGNLTSPPAAITADTGYLTEVLGAYVTYTAGGASAVISPSILRPNQSPVFGSAVQRFT